MSREMDWRRMAPVDLPAVMAIAAVVHPDYPEDETVFAERLRLAPEGCHVLAASDGTLLGYLVSHPWPAGTVPALNSRLGEIPRGLTNWYLHDLALLPSGRGTGAARTIVAEIARHAAETGYTSLALVAVNDSTGFWQRQGFHEMHDPALDRKLASYDDAARYMRRDLNGCDRHPQKD
jgi:GNAT superfamily N-acetyltransferase